jgi:hypothetical protein
MTFPFTPLYIMFFIIHSDRYNFFFINTTLSFLIQSNTYIPSRLLRPPSYQKGLHRALWQDSQELQEPLRRHRSLYSQHCDCKEDQDTRHQDYRH